MKMNEAVNNVGGIDSYGSRLKSKEGKFVKRVRAREAQGEI